ncbi:MAG TPA: CSLREA domain-containing protein [Solirubrobacterales bacterium]
MPDPFLKTLASTLAIAVLALLALPAFAGANTYFVNTLDDLDEATPFACIEVSIPCSLRDAIQAANANAEVADKIDFEVISAGTIELQSQLPAIIDPLAIEGDTAGAWAGEPVIEIDGTQAAAEYGLRVDEGASEIRGLAITGVLGSGILFAAGTGNVACNNYLGLDPGGAAVPNGTGITVGTEATNTRIGGVVCGNVISGNEGDGIVDEGFNTAIGDNLIGTNVSGQTAIGNGGAGIHVTTEAESTAVTGIGEGSGGNTVAFNGGAGVQVDDADSIVVIYANSIFDNDALGIDILGGEEIAPPVIESVQYEPETKIGGTLVGAPETTYYVDFYANEACDPSGSGEGQTYIQDWTVTTDSSGVALFTAEEEGDEEGEEGLLPIPPDQKVITATATTQVSEAGESTSEFSQCAPQIAPPSPQKADNPAALKLAGPTPENGESVVVTPKEGKVFVQRPGEKKPTLLKDGQEIPVGSIVDATRGKVTLTSINKAGETQTAVFFGGKFLVLQQEGSGLVVLKLRGGNFNACKSARGSGASASGKSGRKLWGSGKGKFRTEGNNGSATVRGTIWLTEDRCSGTFFKVKQGVVTVRDFAAGKTFPLGKGKSYLAEP